MDNVTVESLEKKFPGEGFARFAEIAKIGGFGEPTRDHTGGVDPSYAGGLDIKGLHARIDELKDEREATKNPPSGRKMRSVAEIDVDLKAMVSTVERITVILEPKDKGKEK